ncbi:resistance protein RGC2 [Artemisia annua]|uniref:Resistance protein RGC2 n=1 Tax=Artemisia annua TaxID=35608 RepID=A0A2U1LGE5_ARTAN|nr:resistance protein RGC2 [Artemisia annua]
MHQLQVLKIDSSCESMMEVFESQGINNSGDGSTTYADERRDSDTSVVLATPRINDIEVPHLSNLKEVDISNCGILKYVFTLSTLESLSQLEALKIRNCGAMKVIVEEDGQRTAVSKAVFFPCLKSIELGNLTSLKGFFLGKNEFQWPILDDVSIRNCPKMTIFTFGQSTAKKLKFIRTSLGIHSLEGDLKVKTKFPDTVSTRSHPTTLEQLALSFHNLSQMIVEDDYSIRRIVPSNELLQLQKVVKILVRRCYQLVEVFEVVALEEINDRIGFSESQKTVVELPNLTEVDLEDLANLKYIWKSNQWTVVKFPNLTRLSVDGCAKLEYVFTSSMVGSLLQLQELRVSRAATKVIVKEEEECEGKVNEHELRNLKSIELENLPNLKYIWKSNQWTVVKFPNLTRLSVDGCAKLEYVFTSSMVGSLLQLQELRVSCSATKVIVKEEEECEGKVNEHELRNLKSIELACLPYLKGLCLGKDAFSWPSLDSLSIFNCPEIDVFTNGHSDTPKLKVIMTGFRECNVDDDLNSFIKTNQQSFQDFK